MQPGAFQSSVPWPTPRILRPQRRRGCRAVAAGATPGPRCAALRPASTAADLKSDVTATCRYVGYEFSRPNMSQQEPTENHKAWSPICQLPPSIVRLKRQLILVSPLMIKGMLTLYVLQKQECLLCTCVTQYWRGLGRSEGVCTLAMAASDAFSSFRIAACCPCTAASTSA